MPQSPRSSQSHPSHAAMLDVLPDEQSEQEADSSVDAADDAELAAFRQWKRAQANANVTAAAAAKPAKEPDPYEPDDQVTLLLPTVYRAVIEGREAKGHRVFIAAEQPGQLNEDTGRPGPGLAVTLTFKSGFCRDVPYGVVKSLKKSRAYRANEALKVVPNDTPETEFARLCGVQPMQPGKQAAMLLASDLDAVLAEFDTEQLKVFTEALKRRAQASQGAQGAQRSGDILSSQSFQRG